MLFTLIILLSSYLADRCHLFFSGDEPEQWRDYACLQSV